MPGSEPSRSGASAPVGVAYCGRCGEHLGGDGHGRDSHHGGCAAALILEPPRYCGQCRRRMIVQVVPAGWTARCVEHGDLSG